MKTASHRREARSEASRAFVPRHLRAERRRSPFLRATWAWFFDTDLDTVEKLLISAQMLLGVAVVVLQSRLIAVPPPYIQGNVLTLPAWLWFAILEGLALVHIKCRARVDFRGRCHAAKWSGILVSGLCASMGTRAPVVLIFVAFGALAQLMVAARLSQEAKRHREDLAELAAGQ